MGSFEQRNDMATSVIEGSLWLLLKEKTGECVLVPWCHIRAVTELSGVRRQAFSLLLVLRLGGQCFR